MEGTVEASVAPAYRDRSGRLRVLGILLILIGAFHFFQVLLSLLVMPLLRLTAASTMPESPVLTYISPMFSVWSGTLCLVLGIGSIRARRWVRPLILIRSWYALVTTILGLLFAIVAMKSVLPTTMNEQPPVSSTLVYAVAFAIMAIVGLFMMGLPALFIWGYQPQDVRLTCEARNPSPSWTDRLPIPLLAWCLYLGFVGALWFLIPLFFDVPWFGSFLTGAVGVTVGWLIGVIHLVVLRQAAHRRMTGWIASVMLQIALASSGTVSMLRSGLSGMMKHVHFTLPEQQLRPLLELSESFSWLLAAGVALLGVAHLAFLLWIKRHFVTTPSLPSPPAKS